MGPLLPSPWTTSCRFESFSRVRRKRVVGVLLRRGRDVMQFQSGMSRSGANGVRHQNSGPVDEPSHNCFRAEGRYGGRGGAPADTLTC